MRNYVLTIGGFDPSAGAGVLADIKTFEQHGVYGLSINTANTLQTENKFYSIRWTSLEEITSAIEVLTDAYPIQCVKTGIMPSFDYLLAVVEAIHKKKPHAKIVCDPVIRSSTGFDFLNGIQHTQIDRVLGKIFLITPNTDEIKLLSGLENPDEGAEKLSTVCAVYLKGGHDPVYAGVDKLYYNSNMIRFPPFHENVYNKHGSGCVLSAAITANLALGLTLERACHEAKHYVEIFLKSNPYLLGYHHV